MFRRVSVALTKPLVHAQPNDVCIAIDVLRATPILAVLFDRGCSAVWLAADADAARGAGRASGRLICGEQGGLPPPGFDHGNSPVEFSRLDLAGREVVFATSNGTGTLRPCAPGQHEYAGAFVNLSAVVQTALRALDTLSAPGEEGRLLIACAGTHDQFSIEEAACAGLMVREVLRTDPDAALDDAAEAAHRLYESFGSPEAALQAAGNASRLSDPGLAEDVLFCAQLDITEIVPELSVAAPGSIGSQEPRWPLSLAGATA
ncbi:MAG: hypothetical protein AVDCRST_MAG77-5127 [uncultured Chloroflexi bacterium]|uniref:Probable 2-phosphosulfolactate phosphatase n=1 Tax=uncultured Chloroflexota bacterium TaxID=166587 RepID=A0A6J4K523_9CHLR|nr:MAG: hypothetical protein AVDCRST_MAG77-5127 [uncultured Chloroflexota bacterium]